MSLRYTPWLYKCFFQIRADEMCKLYVIGTAAPDNSIKIPKSPILMVLSSSISILKLQCAFYIALSGFYHTHFRRRGFSHCPSNWSSRRRWNHYLCPIFSLCANDCMGGRGIANGKPIIVNAMRNAMILIAPKNSVEAIFANTKP